MTYLQDGTVTINLAQAIQAQDWGLSLLARWDCWHGDTSVSESASTPHRGNPVLLLAASHKLLRSCDGNTRGHGGTHEHMSEDQDGTSAQLHGKASTLSKAPRP